MCAVSREVEGAEDGGICAGRDVAVMMMVVMDASGSGTSANVVDWMLSMSAMMSSMMVSNGIVRHN
jgi:sulfopyruvate decarboxylase TPP-binding subunit